MIKSTCIGPAGVPVLDLAQPHTSAKYVLRNTKTKQCTLLHCLFNDGAHVRIVPCCLSSMNQSWSEHVLQQKTLNWLI